MSTYKDKSRMYKQFITSYFYDVLRFKGSVTTLAGPQLKRVIGLADKLNPYSINTYEICPIIYDNQLQQYDKYYGATRNNININFGSIEHAEITEFIDADLMKTYKSDGAIIESLLEKQIELESESSKVFIGTLSLRKTTKKNAFTWLSNLIFCNIGRIQILDEPIYTQSSGTNSWMKKFETLSGSNLTLDVFMYNDREGLMMTFRVIY